MEHPQQHITKDIVNNVQQATKNVSSSTSHEKPHLGKRFEHLLGLLKGWTMSLYALFERCFAFFQTLITNQSVKNLRNIDKNY